MQLCVFCLSGYQLLVLYNFLQLIFEGIRGPGIEGDIAIDDVSIVEGECMKSDQPANSKWLFYTLGRANCFLRCRIEVSLKWMSCRRAKYCWVKSERLRVKSFLSAWQRKEPLVQEGPKCLGWRGHPRAELLAASDGSRWTDRQSSIRKMVRGSEKHEINK